MPKLIFSAWARQLRQSVLGWTDRDRTRVLVLPDWADQGYPCTFGERYTSDYSDKSAHDEEDGEDPYPQY